MGFVSYDLFPKVREEIDYIFGENYNILRLLNMLKIAKKYNLELIYE